jgi:hypothetical protein
MASYKNSIAFFIYFFLFKTCFKYFYFLTTALKGEDISLVKPLL